MRLLLDMNLSPHWVHLLEKRGYECIHWSTIGRYDAPDHEIMRWARNNRYTVITHDLDFGAALAATGANGPSVLQIRTMPVLPAQFETLLCEALNRFSDQLTEGALVVVDESRMRVRILPLSNP